MNNPMKALVALSLLATPALAYAAQPPVENVSSFRHGNLAAAQAMSRQAYNYLTAAQQANEYDLGGHAAKAKQLLDQANQEIKLAAIAANNR